MLPSYFDYTFLRQKVSKTKSTSQARIKPEISVNFRPEPDPKSPARLTTLIFLDFPDLGQITKFNPKMLDFKRVLDLT